MVETKRTITLLEVAGKWRSACTEALEQRGIGVTEQEPNTWEGSVAEGDIVILTMPSLNSRRIELVRTIGNFGGTSLVLSGRDPLFTEKMCRALKNAHYVGPKGLNFTALFETIDKIHSPQEHTAA